MKKSIIKIHNDTKKIDRMLRQLEKDIQKAIEGSESTSIKDALSDLGSYCEDAIYLLETGEDALDNAIQNN